MNEKTEVHVCDENDILTLRMLKKDSKPCPKCNVMIHRISGCPDMFCVECKTAFNWNTLKINVRGNSNPHYYEWLRDRRNINSEEEETASERDTRVCSRYVDTGMMFEYLRDLPVAHIDAIMSSIRSVHHGVSQHMENLRQLRAHILRNDSRDFGEITRKFRIQFMRNESSEETFKRDLLRVSKAYEYNGHLDQISSLLEEYRQSMMLSAIHQSFDLQNWLDDYIRTSIYTNSCYLHLRNAYYGDNKHQNLHNNMHTMHLCVLIPANVKTMCTNYDAIRDEFMV
jgi:hypothetical protein